MTDPRRTRPKFPEGYGLPDTEEGLLDWPTVRERLVTSKVYWLATVRPDGRPHVVPRWGVWVNDRLYYDGSPETRHARNLDAGNHHVTMNLEDGLRAVIIEGISERTRAQTEGLGTELATAYAKYHDDGYSPSADAWSDEDGGGLRVITPTTALAWFAYPTDATRFVF